MITFDLDTLRSVAKAATRELDYWYQLFREPSGRESDSPMLVPLGVVAVVLSEAIEAGVVQLVHACPEQNGGGDEKSDPPGYMKGWKDGRESRERELELLNKTAQMDAYDRGYELGIAHGAASLDDAEHFDSDVLSNVREILGRWMQMLLALANDLDRAGETEGVAKLTTELMTIRSTFDLYEPLDDEADTPLSPDFDGGFYTQTPAGHTIHVNGDPDMSEETAEALREVADKVFEHMSKKVEQAPETAPPKDPYPGPPLGTARAGDEDDPPPPSAALIYKREPTEAEIAYGQKLARELDQVETISPAAAATPSVREPPGRGTGLGPEHVVPSVPFGTGVTPLVPRRKLSNGELAQAATTGDFDYTPGGAKARLADIELDADARRAHLWDIIHALREMAEDNQMPSKTKWDGFRPEGMPMADAILKKFDFASWGDLAARAQLKYKYNPRPGRPLKTEDT